jgi:hypothetical protein
MKTHGYRHEQCSHEATFYQDIFGMKRSEPTRAGGAVVVGDGYVGLNLNPRAPGRQAGFDHFGFEVQDTEVVFGRLKDKYPKIQVLHRPSNRPFAGISMHDPNGNVFDLSQLNMENRRDIYTDKVESANGVSATSACAASTPIYAANFIAMSLS